MKKNNKGFTLAELLIVVAIIAVLAAIAIPVFTAQLQKAKIAADEANVRSWYAEVSSKYLLEGDKNWTDPEDYNDVVSGYPALQAEDADVEIGGSFAGGNFNVTYTAKNIGEDLVIGKTA